MSSNADTDDRPVERTQEAADSQPALHQGQDDVRCGAKLFERCIHDSKTQVVHWSGRCIDAELLDGMQAQRSNAEGSMARASSAGAVCREITEDANEPTERPSSVPSEDDSIDDFE